MDLLGVGWQEMAMVLLLVIALIFYAGMLIHLLLRNRAATIFKIVWALVIVLIPITGALLYYWFCVAGDRKTVAR